MARGVNKVILVGNLGNDPDTKYTQGGTCICTMSIATTSVRKDGDGETVEKTEWHRVKAFGKTGEICAEYLTKGRQVYIEGRIEYGSYEKDGVKHYTTDVIVNEVQFLGGGNRDEDRPARSESARRTAPARGSAPTRQSRPAREAPQREEKQQDFADDFADDDIPF